MSGVAKNKLPKGWQLIPLGTFRGGKAKSINPSEIISGKEIGSSKRVVVPNTVLLSKINPRINRVWIVGSASKHRQISSPEWVEFFPTESVEPKYLMYFMQNYKFREHLSMNVSGVGGSLTRIRPKVAEDYEIPLAPYKQQKRIVAKIEELFTHIDAGIKALKKAKQLLKQYRQSVLKAAVTGELTKEWREANKAKLEPASQLLERILKERRQKWEEQQLEQFKAKGKMPKNDKWKKKYKELALPSAADFPEIPASWKWVELQHVFDVITDGDHQAPPKADDGVPFLVIGDVNKGVIKFGDKRFVPRSYYEGLAEIRRPRKGDLLYTVVGSFGIPVKVESDKEFCVQRHIAILKPSSRMSANFLYHILSSGFVFRQAADVSTGTAQKTVPLGGLRELKIPLPSYEEQVALENLIESKLDAISRTEKESTNKILMAEKNKQSILASAFSGELIESIETDGSAKELLDKIYEQNIIEQAKEKLTKRKPVKKKVESMSKRKIVDVLKESADLMTVDQLFDATGYGEDPDEIENFYLELKQVVDDNVVSVETNYSADKKQENTFRYVDQS